ncbi:MAG: DUF3383 family protein [Cytophagaceae bacterium]|nr:MAG: DUF3383 family protein [Cytophagaceae bacterium]
MTALDNLVNIQISQNTQAVPLDSFAIPLIIGKSNPGWTDRVHSYVSPAGLLADGFTTSSPEYIAAQSMFAGSITPTQFEVGLRTGDSLANDLSAIVSQDNSWYGCMLASPTDADIQALAAAIEPMKKIALTSTSTLAVAQSGSSDFASTLKGQKLKRTAITYTQNQNGILEAAWLGSQLPQVPGSNNWAYNTLPSVTPDALTANQTAILYGTPIAGIQGKNVNTYTTVGGVPITLMGQMVGGQYIDITIGLDWLQSTISTGIFSVLANSLKVPYTDAGASMLMLPVATALQQGVANGLLDGNDTTYPIKVTCDPVASVPRNQRAARIGPTIRFQARLQGAVNSVAVAGTITV